MHHLVTVIASVALTTVIIGLVSALALERARRLDLAARVTHLEALLTNLERVGRNKLYREAIENKQTQVVQAARRLRVARQDLDDAMRILNLEPKE